MVKHIILWKLKDELADKKAAAAEVKSRLESLAGRIPGLVSIEVHTDALPSSNADMMLCSLFTDADALAGYQTNPLHVEAATYVRSVVVQRLCLDFEVEG